MLKLLPFTEVAASAGAALRQELPQRPRPRQGSLGGGELAPPAQPGQSTETASGDPAPAAAGDAIDMVATRMRTQAADAAAVGRAGTAGSQAVGGTVTSAPEEPRAEERLPGMDPIWQAENGAWPPLNLGPGGWGGPTEYVPPDGPADSETPGPGTTES
jgi:hypothetical protein